MASLGLLAKTSLAHARHQWLFLSCGWRFHNSFLLPLSLKQEPQGWNFWVSIAVTGTCSPYSITFSSAFCFRCFSLLLKLFCNFFLQVRGFNVWIFGPEVTTPSIPFSIKFLFNHFIILNTKFNFNIKIPGAPFFFKLYILYFSLLIFFPFHYRYEEEWPLIFIWYSQY